MSSRANSYSLAVDVSPLMELQWTGIPVFTRRIVQSLLRRPEIDVLFCCDLLPVETQAVLSAIEINSGAMLREDFERANSNGGQLIDLNRPIFYPSVKKFHRASAREAVTVHDISTLVMPEYHQAENVDFHLDHLGKSLESSEAVFCVSSATRRALETTFPSAKNKTRLLFQYADWPPSFDEMERNFDPPAIGPYVVVIGTLEPRKNLELIFRALAEPSIRDSDIKFVIIGRKGWLVDDFLQTVPAVTRERVIFTGFVSEFTKFRLLRHCEYLVFPSLYEGFGIPALEAMSLGKPVLASMTTSFPEVIGDAGLYFDPFSPSDFASKFDEMKSFTQLHGTRQVALDNASKFNAHQLSQAIYQWLQSH